MDCGMYPNERAHTIFLVSMANPWKHMFFCQFITYHSYICSFKLETLHMFFLHLIYWSQGVCGKKTKNHRTPLRPKNAAGFQCGGILGPTCTRIQSLRSQSFMMIGKKNGQKNKGGKPAFLSHVSF